MLKYLLFSHINKEKKLRTHAQIYINKVLQKKTKKKLLQYVISHSSLITEIEFKAGCPRGVMVKAMDCGIVVREFVL